MIHINLLSRTITAQSRQIMQDLERHAILGSFLDAVVSIAGWEVRWEFMGEYIDDPDGFLRYVELGRRVAEIKYIGPPLITVEYGDGELQV